VTIAAGGTVTWVMTDHDHDVTFTGPQPPGGNIPETEEDESASRTFPTPGTYTYQCAEHADDGMTGTIVVVAGTTPPPGGETPPPGGETPPTSPPPSGSTATVSTPGDAFSPQTVTISAGGTVTWNISGATHNVTFGGTAPTGGNIPDTRGASVSRSFPAIGTYDYQCTRHDGMTGRVVVQ
jgi:plastocyanin